MVTEGILMVVAILIDGLSTEAAAAGSQRFVIETSIKLLASGLLGLAGTKLVILLAMVSQPALQLPQAEFGQSEQ